MADITETQLLLYQDGDLDEEETRLVEEYLKDHPEVAKDIKWWDKEMAILGGLGIGRMSHEEFKKKVDELVSEDPEEEADDPELEGVDIPPDIPIEQIIAADQKDGPQRPTMRFAHKETSELVAVPSPQLPSVPPPTAANDNSWLRVAASLLIVAFVGYGIYNPISGPFPLAKSDQQFAALLKTLAATPDVASLQEHKVHNQNLKLHSYAMYEQEFPTPGQLLRGDVLQNQTLRKVGRPEEPEEIPVGVRVTVKSGDLRTRVTDGDILRVGDELKIIFDAFYEDGVVSVDFKGHDGKIQELLAETEVLRGESFRLPEKGRYKIEPGEGAETISISFRKKGKPPTSRYFSYLKVERRGVKGETSYASASLSEGSQLKNDELKNKFADFFSLDGAEEFLSSFQLASNVTAVKTRGPAGNRVFKKVASSVVKVLTNDGAGAGIILSEGGLIATNHHVIKGYSRLGISFMPGNSGGIDSDQAFFATKVAVDEIADLALLKLEGDLQNLSVAKLATQTDAGVKPLENGDDVHAIGHPSGLDWTYTKGTVSQIRKQFKWPADDEGKFVHVADVIQTQTAINPGNSGGPLINNEGEVVGINSFTKKGTEGLNFAVSVDALHRLLSQKKDILFPRPHTTEQLKDRTNVRSLDTDKNGKPDLYLVFVKKPKPHVLGMVDKNEDGEIDHFFIDKNADRKIEAKIFPRIVGSRRIYVWRIDSDLDGKTDLIGLDLDGDWKPDKIRPIRKPVKKSNALLRYVE